MDDHTLADIRAILLSSHSHVHRCAAGELLAEVSRLRAAADWDVMNALAELDIRTVERDEAVEKLAVLVGVE